MRKTGRDLNSRINPMTTYKIVSTLCSDCGKCVEACYVEAISATIDKHYIDPKLCARCGACAGVYPQDAIVEVDE